MHTTSYSNLIETMRLSCTVFELLSFIFQKLKRSRDSDHTPFKDSLSSVGWDLLCSTTHVPNVKCLRLPATKIRKITQNVKILVLSHTMGDLGVTRRVYLWLDGNRIVDFLLVIEPFSLALTAAALLSKICQNRRFLKGWVTLSANVR